MNGYCLIMETYDENADILFFRKIENAYAHIKSLLLEDINTNQEYFPHDLNYYNNLTIERLFELIDIKSEHVMFVRSSPNNFDIQCILYKDEPQISYFQKLLDKFYYY